MTIQTGTKGKYWRDKRPLLSTDFHPATVVAVSGDQVRVEVDNQRTGRKFFADAKLSDKLGAGCFTPDEQPTPAPAPARAPSRVSSSGKGGATPPTE